jgi:hypothetical protein
MMGTPPPPPTAAPAAVMATLTMTAPSLTVLDDRTYVHAASYVVVVSTPVRRENGRKKLETNKKTDETKHASFLVFFFALTLVI